MKLILNWKNLTTTESIATRDTLIQAMSSTGYGASGTYGFYLSESLKVHSTLAFDYIKLTEDNSITLSKKKMILKDFDFGLDLFKNYSASLGFTEKIYLSSQSVFHVDVKTLVIPNLAFGYNKRLWELGLGAIDAGVGTRILLPASGESLKTDLSVGYNTQLKFSFKDEAFVLGYEYLPIRSGTNKTDVQNIFWNFVIGF